MLPNTHAPMVIIPVAVISMSSLAKKKNNLGNMHNTMIHLQFWAYGSWDSLFLISMSQTANL